MASSMKAFQKLSGVLLTFCFLISSSTIIFADSKQATKVTEHDISKSSLYIEEGDGDYIVTGSTTSNTITVAGGEHNITFKDVTVDVNKLTNTPAMWVYASDVNLKLEGESTLVGGKFKAGIFINGAFSSLRISEDSTGTINAVGGSNAPGIAAMGTHGEFDINGGTIIATGSNDKSQDANEITTNIQPGIMWNNGTVITINGGNVTAIGANNGNGMNGTKKNLIVNGGKVTAKGGSSEKKGGSGILVTSGKVIINDGEVDATGGPGGAGITSQIDGAIRVSGGTISAQGGKGGAGIGGAEGYVGGTVTIDGGTVNAQGGEGGAGIGGGSLCSGGDITIQDGTVTATGGSTAAGIGGGYMGDSGNIDITGGKIVAVAGKNSAGIGGGQDGNVQLILVSGGNINSLGKDGAASIGGGLRGGSGTITITSGTINTSKTKNTGDFIGSGYKGQGCTTNLADTATISKQIVEQGSSVTASIFGNNQTYVAVCILAFVAVISCIIYIIIRRKNSLTERRGKQ